MRLAWVRGNWSSRGPPPRPGWRNPSPWRTIPPPMSLLAFLLVAQTATQDTVRPYLAFPEPGLDDPAAYEGYATRVYQDASHNAFQVYLKGNTGRVVNLWADAANESVGFTVRDSSGRPAELAWGSSGGVVTGSAHTRSVSYTLELPSTVSVGLFLLGSMRVERDFQYAGRDSLSLGTPAFPQSELAELIDHIAKLKTPERARHLSLLGVKTVDALRARLSPRVTAKLGDTVWVVRVEQESFDGKNHLRLALEGDARETVPTLSGSIVTVRRPAGGPVRLTVRVTTDAPALVPLGRAEIFNEDFQRFAAQVRADTAHPLTSRRLEREVRGVELLCYREKLMAGLPNFATYFGRDMLMTALLMQPVWAPAMSEHVVASALGKLSPTGDVSHEEALGGQAIRENAAEYNRLVSAGQLARARALLAHLAATRENYIMVDDGFQLPVVAARPRGPPASGGDLGGRGAPLPGGASPENRERPRRRPVAVAAASGRGVLEQRRAADGCPRGHAAVSRSLARWGGSAHRYRQHRSRDAAARRLARPRSDARADRADHAAAPLGAVRGRARSRGRERCLRHPRRVGGVSPGSVSLSDGRVGPRRERAARGPRAAAPGR